MYHSLAIKYVPDCRVLRVQQKSLGGCGSVLGKVAEHTKSRTHHTHHSRNHTDTKHDTLNLPDSMLCSSHVVIHIKVHNPIHTQTWTAPGNTKKALPGLHYIASRSARSPFPIHFHGVIAKHRFHSTRDCVEKL